MVAPKNKPTIRNQGCNSRLNIILVVNDTVIMGAILDLVQGWIITKLIWSRHHDTKIQIITHGTVIFAYPVIFMYAD